MFNFFSLRELTLFVPEKIAFTKNFIDTLPAFQAGVNYVLNYYENKN
jgi:hypothetical protein